MSRILMQTTDTTQLYCSYRIQFKQVVENYAFLFNRGIRAGVLSLYF